MPRTEPRVVRRAENCSATEIMAGACQSHVTLLIRPYAACVADDVLPEP